MFAPDGFAVLSEFHYVCWDAARKLFPILKDDSLENRLKADTGLLREALFHQQVTADWLVWIYLCRTDTEKYLCSPTGDLIKVSDLFLAENERAIRGYKVINLFDFNPFAAAPEDRIRLFLSLRRPFLFFDLDTAIVDGPPNRSVFRTLHIVRETLGGLPLREWRRALKILHQNYRANNITTARYWKPFRHFVGWSVCLKKTDALQNVDDLLELLALEEHFGAVGSESAENVPSDRSRGGRPAKVPMLKEIYLRALNGGARLDRMSQKELARLLEVESGASVSPRTAARVAREVGQNGSDTAAKPD